MSMLVWECDLSDVHVHFVKSSAPPQDMAVPLPIFRGSASLEGQRGGCGRLFLPRNARFLLPCNILLPGNIRADDPTIRPNSCKRVELVHGAWTVLRMFLSSLCIHPHLYPPKWGGNSENIGKSPGGDKWGWFLCM
eukprot:1992527-Pyramimonas_sp.AAC.1